MTEITINRTCAIIDRCEQFTSGRVGARIKFSFSSEWAGLNKTAVFTNGDTTIDVLNVTDECVIPHEVLAISGKKLKVGVYGFTADDDGNIEIAIPTVYAELGKVVKGADPSGDESTEPSLPVWAQIQSDVNDLDDRVTELKEDLALKADKDEIPTALPNPHKLTINGTEYDGSADVQMTIQGGGGGESYDDTELRQRIGAIESKESTWDAKSNFSGNYNDLTNKPTIPEAVTDAHINGLIDAKIGNITTLINNI